jgi:hypothetical protein
MSLYRRLRGEAAGHKTGFWEAGMANDKGNKLVREKKNLRPFENRERAATRKINTFSKGAPPAALEIGTTRIRKISKNLPQGYYIFFYDLADETTDPGFADRETSKKA